MTPIADCMLWSLVVTYTELLWRLFSFQQQAVYAACAIPLWHGQYCAPAPCSGPFISSTEMPDWHHAFVIRFCLLICLPSRFGHASQQPHSGALHSEHHTSFGICPHRQMTMMMMMMKKQGQSASCPRVQTSTPSRRSQEVQATRIPKQ